MLKERKNQPDRNTKYTPDTVLDYLTHFRTHANDETFTRIFGDMFGPHLWQKFKSQGYDAHALWSSLDNSRRRDFINYIHRTI
jgi:hypothetical protein